MCQPKKANNLIRIAIYDDESGFRENMADIILDAGFDPVPINQPFGSLPDCILGLKQFDRAVLDHRLSPGNFADFLGVVAVKELYSTNFPVLLMSAWDETPEAIEELQPYRRQLAKVITKSDACEDLLIEGFDKCIGEFHGSFELDRRPARTLMRIVSCGDTRVNAYIPSWGPKTGVSFPKIIIPGALHPHVIEDAWFCAEVNTGADSLDELYFENFTLPPEIDDEIAKLFPS